MEMLVNYFTVEIHRKSVWSDFGFFVLMAYHGLSNAKTILVEEK